MNIYSIYKLNLDCRTGRQPNAAKYEFFAFKFSLKQNRNRLGTGRNMEADPRNRNEQVAEPEEAGGKGSAIMMEGAGGKGSKME